MPVITTSESAVPQAVAALAPNPHDVALAIETSRKLGALVQATGDVQLTVAGEGGLAGQIVIPASAFHLLFAVLSEMSRGKGVAMLPLDAELTTQQAADLLRVSRPYLVGRLEKGDMRFRRVGNQRRVRLQDVMAYKTRTDIDRRAALQELAQIGQDMGLGYER